MIKHGRLRLSRRSLFILIAALVVTNVVVEFLASPWRHTGAAVEISGDGPVSLPRQTQGKLYILLPATQSNVDFCKTLLTMTILGYPKPRIVGWGGDDSPNGLVARGSYYLKITKVLDWLNNEERRKDPAFEDDLVFVLDSYDIWFQLPMETLLSRYHDIVAKENSRAARRMGRAHDAENLHSTIIFGAGKRCAPNNIYTGACNPVSDSPLADDLRGGASEAQPGRFWWRSYWWSSYRPRFLNSGYMIGPVKDVRRMLERAKEKLDECVDRSMDKIHSGKGFSDFCHHRSDQSVFVEMYGEQEFHREVMRRHHRTFFDDWLDRFFPDRPGSTPRPTQFHGARIVDPLHPSFPHEEVDKTYLPGKPFEFGIGLDYWSSLGHQSVNAEYDHEYIIHDLPLAPQVSAHGRHDCPATTSMPTDVPPGGVELLDNEPKRWESLPLFTELCVGSVPVMIHHSAAEEKELEVQWGRTWWHGRARHMMQQRLEMGAPQLVDGFPTDNGFVFRWQDLCPADMEPELFRDEDRVPTSAKAEHGGSEGKTEPQSSRDGYSDDQLVLETEFKYLLVQT